MCSIFFIMFHLINHFTMSYPGLCFTFNSASDSSSSNCFFALCLLHFLGLVFSPESISIRTLPCFHLIKLAKQKYKSCHFVSNIFFVFDIELQQLSYICYKILRFEKKINTFHQFGWEKVTW